MKRTERIGSHLDELGKVRQAGMDDVQAISLLLAESRGKDVGINEIKTQISIIVNDNDRVIILLDNQGVKAMAVVNMVFKLPKAEARIDEVFVSQAMRGKGYGDTLMEACEQWAWSRGAGSIELTSRPTREAANAMYQKRGYQLRPTNVYNKRKEA